MEHPKHHRRGIALKKQMLEVGISQRELAEKTGTSWAYMNHILSGRKSGDLYLQEICKVLQLTYEDIKGIED